MKVLFAVLLAGTLVNACAPVPAPRVVPTTTTTDEVRCQAVDC